MVTNIKRIIVIIIYLILFFLVGLFFYSILKPSPTCFDNKQNQGEDGVDCGGSCQDCKEAVEAQNLVVENKSFIYGGPDKYDVLAEIYNPNDLYGSAEFSYKFILKDSAGKVLAERSGKEFILPAETKNVVEVNLETAIIPSMLEVEVADPQWSEFWDYEKPRLSIYKKQYNQISSGIGFGEAYGLLRNESAFDFRVVSLNVILRNSSGEAVAVNKTEMRDVNANEERDFKLLWPNSFPGDVQRVDVEASANIYNSENFVQKYLRGGKFQEYK